MNKTINIAIRKKVANQTNKTLYICGNSDFVVNFEFDAEWDEFSVKTARFIHSAGYTDVVFEGNLCAVPVISNTHNIKVGVFAGNLRTTTPAHVSAKKSILCDSGSPAPPSADVYNQIMDIQNKLVKRVDDLAAGVIPGATGWSDSAKSLLITILQAALYGTNQDDNIKALAVELGVEINGDPDQPVIPDKPEDPDNPDEPEVPVTQKLTAPEIYLEIDGEPVIPDEPDVSDRNTPAILGVAVLGKTVLGNYTSGLPKLDAPVIRLTSAQKLDAPVIRLDMVDDSEPKLGTPVIRLETGTESDDPDDPSEPDNPDEPDEPDVPVTPKLEAPVIHLEGCDHMYTSVTTAPTCTERGYTTNTCSACGDSYVDSYVDATGHSWNDGVVTKKPTEQETGVRTYTCNTCGATRTEVIPVLDHVHSYVATVTNPTCTDRGYTTHTCTCGDSHIDSYVDALGHDWNEPYFSSEFATGYGRKCNRCGALEVMEVPLPKLATPAIRLVDTKLAAPVIDIHDYTSTVVEPTCTEQGYTIHTCACGDRYVDTFIDALGHDWGDSVDMGNYTVKECKRCGEQDVKGGLSVDIVSENFEPEEGTFWEIDVIKPNGKKQTIYPTASRPHFRLINLNLGSYTISEREFAEPGYNVTTSYMVQLADEEPVEGQTATLTKEKPYATITITNRYEKID